MERFIALVTDRQPPVAGQPGQCPLHDPAMPPQPLRVFHAPPRDPIGDPALAQGGAARRVVIAFIGVQLGRIMRGVVRPDARLHRVEQGREHGAVVSVGPGQPRREWGATTIDHEVPFRTGFAAIRRTRADRIAPFFAAMLALSRHARDQSILPAPSKRSSSARWRRCQTPARAQSRSRRQHVTPLPHPNSVGSIRHWMPVRRTKITPHKAARSATRGRPPCGWDGCAGSNGSIVAHNSSVTSPCTFIEMAAQYRCHGFETASKYDHRTNAGLRRTITGATGCATAARGAGVDRRLQVRQPLRNVVRGEAGVIDHLVIVAERFLVAI